MPKSKKRFEYLGAIGIILSSIGLFWNYTNQQDQNKRWSKLNDPAIEITELVMVKYYSLPTTKYLSSKFDYNGIIIGRPEEDSAFFIIDLRYLKVFRINL